MLEICTGAAGLATFTMRSELSGPLITNMRLDAGSYEVISAAPPFEVYVPIE